MLPILGLFLLLIFAIAFFNKKNTIIQQKTEEDFWSREAAANHVRRQDISGLPYITIPFENFPFGISDDAGLKEIEQNLKSLEGQKILNLGTQTNTDLKMKYGPANLNDLMEFDKNFTTLVPLLVSYSETLIALGYETEAIPVLEFGVSCGSDNSKNYSILAELYKKDGNSAKIQWLKDCAAQLDSLMKQPIIDKLDRISAS